MIFKCGHCFTIYKPTVKHQKYCDSKCAKQARYQRHLQSGKIAEWQYKCDLQRLYGLTVEQHAEILKAQDGKCKICNELPKTKSLFVDHCHKTGKVRGLLCVYCNSLLGMAKDSPTILQNAINYLGA